MEGQQPGYSDNWSNQKLFRQFFQSAQIAVLTCFTFNAIQFVLYQVATVRLVSLLIQLLSVYSSGCIFSVRPKYGTWSGVCTPPL